MEVQLYIYDLSQGMAREFSQQFIGEHIEAIYHTSCVLGGTEYFFGSGIQTCRAGSTHHGRPMEVVSLGITQLPPETISEYLESLREIYSPESYDLFAHNCNNFTNDFAMFLVGKGIPDHITNLPERVLNTPFGQILKPQLDASMRSITQAPVQPQIVPASIPTTNGTSAARPQTRPSVLTKPTPSAKRPRFKAPSFGSVINVTTREDLRRFMTSRTIPVIIFFASSNSVSCRTPWPMFNELAKQYPQARFVCIDIEQAPQIANEYNVTTTPTFLIAVKYELRDKWTGADPEHLRAKVKQLMERLSPPHPHASIEVPTLQFGSLTPVTYVKVPPLDKLMAKLPPSASDKELAALRKFVGARTEDPRNATLPPDLPAIAKAFQTDILTLPVDVRFAAVDLLRCAMVDPRVGGFFAEEERTPGTISSWIKHVSELDNCPHNLRLVTLHLACNFFASTLAKKEIMGAGNVLAPVFLQLVISSLLDTTHPTTRVAAASLAYNLASANYVIRDEVEREGLEESQQVELAASLLEALSGEQSSEATKLSLLSLGYLLHFAPQDGELSDVANVLDAKSIVARCNGHKALAKEVASLL